MNTKLETPIDIIPCAFCHGKGVDPFNVMSENSVCTACSGRRVQEVPVPNDRCHYCCGTGSHKTFRCPVCGGIGRVPAAPLGAKKCVECGGLSFDGSSGLPCLVCRGRGVIESS